jgi:hypothetical protein
VRHEGLTLRRRAQVLKAKHLAVLALGVAAQAQQHGQPFLPALALAYISLAFVRHWSGWVVVINPVFQRAEQLTINYSDAELYSYRITDRNYIAQLLQLLQIPQTFVSPNRGRMTGEECFLLWLSYASSPTRLQDLQRRHGLEYSQISRWIRVMWILISLRSLESQGAQQPRLLRAALPRICAAHRSQVHGHARRCHGPALRQRRPLL